MLEYGCLCQSVAKVNSDLASPWVLLSNLAVLICGCTLMMVAQFINWYDLGRLLFFQFSSYPWFSWSKELGFVENFTNVLLNKMWAKLQVPVLGLFWTFWYLPYTIICSLLILFCLHDNQFVVWNSTVLTQSSWPLSTPRREAQIDRHKERKVVFLKMALNDELDQLKGAT